MLRTLHLIIIIAVGVSTIIITLAESRNAISVSISRIEPRDPNYYPQIDLDVIEKYPPLYDAMKEIDVQFENIREGVCKPECPQPESGPPVIQAASSQ
jgi:hypothetical protein